MEIRKWLGNWKMEKDIWGFGYQGLIFPGPPDSLIS